MITTSGEISFDDVELEMFGTSGTEYSLSDLLDLMNQYNTGATHTHDDMEEFYGFTGGDVWHFLNVQDCVDDGNGTITITVVNWSPHTAKSGMLEWEVYDSVGIRKGYGISACNDLGASTYTDIYATYSGSAYRLRYRWQSYTNGWTEFYF